LSSGSISVEPPAAAAAAPPVAADSGKGPGLGRYGAGTLFLLPALILLVIWMVYPIVYTVLRSFFGRSGFDDFVGIDNYDTLFTTPTLTTAIKNNLIWVAVVPAFVTALGLIFAVLTERVNWAVAFKTVVFLPMAISAFATGVTWRIMYVQDPNLGAINAVGRAAHEIVHPSGSLATALPSTPGLTGSAETGMVLQTPLEPNSVALLGLTAIPPEDVPSNATQAMQPKPAPGRISGVVWRDFKPGGGVAGRVETGELGLPGVTVQLRDSENKVVKTAASGDDGSFDFGVIAPGTYHAGVSAQTFAKPWGGYAWLGTKLITPSLIIAYIWIWAGFAMVVIGAGLAAMPRDVLEAARTDGASEWQVFRRVTVPLLAPVLSVVFITMVINVLKVFDLVITLAPGSSQNAASVIALAMWRTSFGGINDFGVGSAIAVFLFVLVVPVLALNIKRFRTEV
jgi:alpha-glucoside transport system permease protein